MELQTSADRSQIAFFDVETTVPTRVGQGYALLEFGAILVCPRTLVELDSYSTLIRPSDLSLLSPKSVMCNGISKEDVVSAPSFAQIADKVFDLLHGRVWAGHNILRFDCRRINEAFAEIGKTPPEPKGTIDSLALLTQRFGRRAGNMKMATLATYFDLGKQSHRSLDDVRLNLEVLKYCATVLFLESSLPEELVANNWASPVPATRSRTNGKASPATMVRNMSVSIADSSSEAHKMSSPTNQNLGEQILGLVESSSSRAEPFSMTSLSEEIKADSIQDVRMTEPLTTQSLEISPSVEAPSNGSSTSPVLLTPDEVSIDSITASFVPFYHLQRIQILHKGTVFKLQSMNLRVRFGISTRFLDSAGRPRLSFVVDAPPRLSELLDACDNHVQALFKQSGSASDWRPTSKKTGLWNLPTIRLHIPTIVTGNVAKYATDIYHKEAPSTAEQRIVFSKFDATELDRLFTVSSLIDAQFSLDPYDFQQNAGIRLVAEKLVIQSK